MPSARRAPVGRIAYVDGRYLRHDQASLHIEDRGLQFADAVYEVFAVEEGCILDEEEHFDRLERSLHELAMPMPLGRRALGFVLREVMRRNRVQDGLIYLQATRGAVRRDHAIPASGPRPTLILTARSTDAEAFERRRLAGVGVVTRPDERWARCDIKSTSLLPNVLAKTAARAQGAYEAWFVDRDGHVTEGSSTTAWIVDRDGHLVTRDLDNAVLPGVTRRVLAEVAAESQLAIVERRFTPAEALEAREAFLTAATAAVLPIVSLDGKPIGDGTPGPIARRLMALYRRTARAKAASIPGPLASRPHLG
jgi:D-alanine transaminase